MENKKTKHCHYCQNTTPKIIKDWIVERQFLGEYGRILKEIIVGGNKSEEKRKPIDTFYYCSFNCVENQMNNEEEELWKKGNCQICNKPLAVINNNCQDLQHKKIGCLFPIETPECLKKTKQK